MTARDRLAGLLSADLVELIEATVDERVEQPLAEGQQENGGSPWLSVVEAAGYLRVSERQVQRLVARGRVRSSTVGRRRLLHRDDLDKAATGEGVAPTTPPRHREE